MRSKIHYRVVKHYGIGLRTKNIGILDMILEIIFDMILQIIFEIIYRSGPKKTMTATDVTGFDAIFSTGFSLLSPDFRGLVLPNCT